MDLRKQVAGEIKLRRYIFNTVLTLSLIYVLGTLVFSDMGLLRYIEIRDRHAALAAELSHIESQNAKLKESLDKYRADDYYLEKHARESYGLAAPDEVIYLYKE